MCSMIAGLGSQVAPTFADAKVSPKEAINYVNLLVNGNFETFVKQAPVADKVSTCLSVICALVKEFNLDWVAEDVSSRPISEQKAFLAAFGGYLDIPLRTLSQLLKRLRYIGRRSGALGFQNNVYRYFDVINLGDQVAPTAPRPTVLLIAYLATALEAHRQWCSRRTPVDCLPWTLRVNRKGTRVFIRYTYWKKGERLVSWGLVKSWMDYIIPCKLPDVTADGVRSISSTYK